MAWPAFSDAIQDLGPNIRGASDSARRPAHSVARWALLAPPSPAAGPYASARCLASTSQGRSLSLCRCPVDT